MSLPPSLAFYAEHPREMEALWELEEAPPDVSDADWRVLQAVKQRLNEHVASLVTDCREETRATLLRASPRLHFYNASSPSAAATHWNAWVNVAPSKAKTGQRLDLCFIVRFDPESQAAVVVPTVAALGGRSAVDPVVELLRKHSLVARAAREWAGYSCVALEGTPLSNAVSVDSVVQGCVRAAAALAPHLSELFRISGHQTRG